MQEAAMAGPTLEPSSAWEGRLVRLRAVEASDWDAFRRDGSDTEAQRAYGQVHFPRSSDSSRRWAERESLAERDDGAWRFAIESLDTGELVGGMSTERVDLRNGTFSYGLGTFREHRRKGYAADAILIVLRYYFTELRCQKVNAEVYDFNEGSLRLHRKLGFVEEGRVRRALFTLGSYHDEVRFGMTAEEFFERYG
jgi:RimJ/RimL family protein N-acetyltransferase